MREHLSDFLDFIGSEKGLSPNTIEAYQRDIQAFMAYLQQRSTPDFVSVTQDDIVQFLGYLRRLNYAIATILRHLVSIKVLFRFLKRENITKKNVTLYLESPKLWELLPDVLSVKEVDMLLHQPDVSTFFGARSKAILELMYGSGLRVSEVVQVKIRSVSEDYVRVFGKGGKERVVPFGRFASQAIDHFLLHYRDRFDSEREEALFVTNRGKPIDRVSVWRMIKFYAKKADIAKNVFPHTLRHSFATHLIDNGAELRVIQEMLGHANINTTNRYTHVSTAHLQRAFAAFHPRK